MKPFDTTVLIAENAQNKKKRSIKWISLFFSIGIPFLSDTIFLFHITVDFPFLYWAERSVDAADFFVLRLRQKSMIDIHFVTFSAFFRITARLILVIFS